MPRVLAPIKDDLRRALFDFWSEVFDNPLDQRAQVGIGEMQKPRAVFHARDREEILEEQGESLDIPVDGLERFFGHCRVLDRTIAECFDIAVDDCQRRAEFMGDIGDELAANGLQRADGGDVLEYDQCGAGLRFVLCRKRGDMDDEGSRVERQLKFALVAGGHGGLHGLLDFVAAQDFQHGAIHGVFDVREKPKQRLVAKCHPHGAVRHEDSLAHAREDAAQAQAFIRDLAVELLELARDFPDLRGGFEVGGVVWGEGREVVVAGGHALQIPPHGAPGFDDAEVDIREGRGAERQGKKPLGGTQIASGGLRR